MSVIGGRSCSWRRCSAARGDSTNYRRRCRPSPRTSSRAACVSSHSEACSWLARTLAGRCGCATSSPNPGTSWPAHCGYWRRGAKDGRGSTTRRVRCDPAPFTPRAEPRSKSGSGVRPVDCRPTMTRRPSAGRPKVHTRTSSGCSCRITPRAGRSGRVGQFVSALRSPPCGRCCRRSRADRIRPATRARRWGRRGRPTRDAGPAR